MKIRDKITGEDCQRLKLCFTNSSKNNYTDSYQLKIHTISHKIYASNTNSECSAYTKKDVKDDQPCFRNIFQAIHFDPQFICDFLHNKMITFLESKITAYSIPKNVQIQASTKDKN